MAVQGVFASDMNIVGDRVMDFASQLLKIMPQGTAQLLALSSGMESADAMDQFINWFEEDHLAGRSAITSFVTNGDGTGIVVPDATFFPPGTVLLVEDTGEYLLVTVCVVSTKTLTVTRDMVGGGAVTMTTAHHLQRIGTAFEEGSTKPRAVANLGRVKTNFCQIFRNLWNVTGSAAAAKYITGDIVAKNRADCATFHAEDIERSLWWGAKTIGTLNGLSFKTMDGLYAQIDTNVFTAAATTGYMDLDAFFQTIFSVNMKGKPNERVAYTGNKGLGILNEIALNTSKMEITPGVTAFGMKVSRWITPYGDVSLLTHPLFTESPFRTGDLVVFHPGAFRTRYYRRTFIDNYDQNGTRAGDDADYGVYTTEMSCEYRAEKTAGVYKALQTAA